MTMKIYDSQSVAPHPRAVRNHNPLNIRLSSDKWHGMAKRQTDEEFVQFVNFYYGYRAAVKILDKYYKRGWNTIQLIILHWAPPCENNTDNYTAVVERMARCSRTQRLPPIEDNRALWQRIIVAMTRMESGLTTKEMLAALHRVLSDYPAI